MNIILPTVTTPLTGVGPEDRFTQSQRAFFILVATPLLFKFLGLDFGFKVGVHISHHLHGQSVAIFRDLIQVRRNALHSIWADSK